MWIGRGNYVSCGYFVDELSYFLPQGWLFPITGPDPTSGANRRPSSCIWVLRSSIHTIHKPYGYYDSHLVFNKMLESVL